ncbi:hypothetical protein KCV87_07630 [Actinosynnema pretiosum subsp. pretiosum]|uniref:Esterase n=1 Tax=Actinosynnema pretiosum subsp. pretiosum TaxID=103721 RepID=A0AA45L9P8_9PSEU|nr:hypothetical protein APASM_2502 [Actinosynnema pretiosum subsp. pretiosum]QUF05932.1 hypothetical protein KCV87_07630 [Actinosynnema pretiosum subsp. pretiosum]
MLSSPTRALLKATATALAAGLLATLPVAPAQAQITHPLPTDVTGSARGAAPSSLLGAGVLPDDHATALVVLPGRDHGGGVTRAYRPL